MATNWSIDCTPKEVLSSLIVLLCLVIAFSNDTAWEPLETCGNWFIAAGELGNPVPGDGEPSADVALFSLQSNEETQTEQGNVSVEILQEEPTARQKDRTLTECFLYGVAATLIAEIFIASIVALYFYWKSK